jgi:peroxiredoxin
MVHSLRRSLILIPLMLLPACVASSTTGEAERLPAPTSQPGGYDGQPALEISGKDMDGKVVKLSGLRGKVVLVDFWATWCGPCVGEIPHEKRLAEKFKGRPFAILGISNDHKRETLKTFLDREKLPWPNIFDVNSAITQRWEVDAYPTFVVVNHRGVIVERWVGAGQMAEIEAVIEKAVNAAENDLSQPSEG